MRYRWTSNISVAIAAADCEGEGCLEVDLSDVKPAGNPINSNSNENEIAIGWPAENSMEIGSGSSHPTQISTALSAGF